MNELLEVTDLVKTFDTPGGTIEALRGVSFTLNKGETLGVVGESGCGKSTLARVMVGIHAPSSGSVRIEGLDIAHATPIETQSYRRSVQMVFQDPFGSLNPRLTIGRILAEPFLVHKIGTRADRRERVDALMEMVSLPVDFLSRHPHELSGGQRQRVGIARALALRPKLIVCDEAVSALDVSVQAQILNLLVDLQEQIELSYLFISHDLSVVRYISDRVLVMYLGEIVEVGPIREVSEAPLHPYTMRLLSTTKSSVGAAKQNDEVPSLLKPPSGCRFHPRCGFVQERCRVESPTLRPIAPGRFAACHFAETIQSSAD